MRLRRVEKPRGWTSIPNETIEDASLSWRARGILAYLLSRPENWETDSERIAARGKEGRDAVRTALTELETARYLFRVKVQGAGGHWATEYVLYDRPLEAGSTPGWAPPLDVDGPSAGGDRPGDNPVENPVENGGQPTPGNPSPVAGKPNVGKPGAINNTEEQLSLVPSATTEADAGDAGAIPSEAEREALSRADELTLDQPSAAAVADMQTRSPGLDLFALRAHLVVALGSATLSDARRYALAVAESSAIDSRELTTGLVLQHARRLIASTPPAGVPADGEQSGHSPA